MSFTEIAAKSGGVLVLLLSLVQIMPIKLNPWSAIANAIGKAINKEVLDKVGQIEKDVQSLRSDMQEQEAINCRTRILRFGDECRFGVNHSKDSFDQTLRDITKYESYCEEHPHFENNVTEITSKRIKEIYSERLEKNDFL